MIIESQTYDALRHALGELNVAEEGLMEGTEMHARLWRIVDEVEALMADVRREWISAEEARDASRESR